MPRHLQELASSAKHVLDAGVKVLAICLVLLVCGFAITAATLSNTTMQPWAIFTVSMAFGLLILFTFVCLLAWMRPGPVIVLDPGAMFPKRQTDGAAGYDLAVLCDEPITLQPGERVLVGTGVSIALPPRTEAQIRPRSGPSSKHGITLVNAVGTIDPDYRGEIKLALINLGGKPYTIKSGARLAQMVLARYDDVLIRRGAVLPPTGRNEGGFGSTGGY